MNMNHSLISIYSEICNSLAYFTYLTSCTYHNLPPWLDMLTILLELTFFLVTTCLILVFTHFVLYSLFLSRGRKKKNIFIPVHHLHQASGHDIYTRKNHLFHEIRIQTSTMTSGMYMPTMDGLNLPFLTKRNSWSSYLLPHIDHFWSRTYV